MKNNVGKKLGTVTSILAAFIVAVIFWLIVKYIDSGALSALEIMPSIRSVL